jgi:hypothetical protein
MSRPLNLPCSAGGALLIRRQTRTLLPGYPSSIVLEVEQVLRAPGQ